MQCFQSVLSACYGSITDVSLFSLPKPASTWESCCKILLQTNHLDLPLATKAVRMARSLFDRSGNCTYYGSSKRVTNSYGLLNTVSTVFRTFDMLSEISDRDSVILNDLYQYPSQDLQQHNLKTRYAIRSDSLDMPSTFR